MKTRVEKEVAIAADAGIAIQEYLDKLNHLLQSRGVSNAYGVVSDVEIIIVELLQKQESKVKLGSDVTMNLIHEELGTPKDFVREFLDDQPDILSDENTKQLTRRPVRNKSARIVRLSFRQIGNGLMYLYIALPILLLLIAPFYLLFQIYDHIRFSYWSVLSMTTLVYASIIYISIELVTGFRGRLLLTKRMMIHHRYVFRGLLLTHFILGQALGSQLLNIEYIPILVPLPSFLALILYIITEFIILLRDHTKGLFPLQPEFKPFIRFFTPHYLLVEFSLLLSFYYFDIFRYGVEDTATITIGLLPGIAGIITYWKKYPVSIRFWIVLLALQFAAIFIDVDTILIFTILPIMYFARHFPKKLSFNFNWLESIRNTYREYYNSDD